MLPDQTALIKKIAKYLRIEAKNTTREESRAISEVADRFEKSKGECVGLSTLWVYAKKLEDSPKSDKAIDGIDFLGSTADELMKWDEKSDLSPNIKANIERFISNIILYQDPMGGIISESGYQQLNLPVVLQDTKRGSPEKVFDQNFVTDKAGFKARLEQVVKPQSLILLGALVGEEGHEMAIYQDSHGKISFYDPNTKEYEVATIDGLSEIAWKAAAINLRFHEDRIQRSLKHLDFKIFRFSDDSTYEYPSKESFKPSFKEYAELLKSDCFVNNLDCINNPVVKDLIKQIEDINIINLLEDSDISERAKMIITKYAISDIENRSPILARYLNEAGKDIKEDCVKYKFLKSENLDTLVKVAAKKEALPFLREGELSKISEAELQGKALIWNKHLSLPEVLRILWQIPATEELAEELLRGCKDGPRPSDIRHQILEGISISGALNHNIRGGKLAVAKKIIDVLDKKFGIILSLDFIKHNFGDSRVEIAEYVADMVSVDPKCLSAVSQQYKDLAVEIRVNKILQESKDFASNPQEFSGAKFDSFIKEVQEHNKLLSLPEVLRILWQIPATEELAEELLQGCKDGPRPSDIRHQILEGISISGALNHNIRGGKLAVAKKIIDVLDKKFGIILPLDFIKHNCSDGSVEIAEYVADMVSANPKGLSVTSQEYKSLADDIRESQLSDANEAHIDLGIIGEMLAGAE